MRILNSRFDKRTWPQNPPSPSTLSSSLRFLLGVLVYTSNRYILKRNQQFDWTTQVAISINTFMSSYNWSNISCRIITKSIVYVLTITPEQTCPTTHFIDNEIGYRACNNVVKIDIQRWVSAMLDWHISHTQRRMTPMIHTPFQRRAFPSSVYRAESLACFLPNLHHSGDDCDSGS